MKNAANCVNQCDLHLFVKHQVFESKWRLGLCRVTGVRAAIKVEIFFFSLECGGTFSVGRPVKYNLGILIYYEGGAISRVLPLGKILFRVLSFFLSCIRNPYGGVTGEKITLLVRVMDTLPLWEFARSRVG